MRCVYGLIEECPAVELIFGERMERVDFKGKTDEQVVIERYIKALMDTMSKYGSTQSDLLAKAQALAQFCIICPYRLEQTGMVSYHSARTGEIVSKPDEHDG